VIEGLTHEDGQLHKITKYKGKISAGFAPGEGTNKSNSPKAAGFFRMLKEQVTSQRGKGDKIITIKSWALNEPVQKALEQSLPNPNDTPRRIEIVSLYKTVSEMWESSMAMYSSTDGLLCKSHGVGTLARKLEFTADGDRRWVDREFDGKVGCAFNDCPDKQANKCKPIGLLKCFPVVDMAPNPYRFETRSINTIIGIESALQDLERLLMAAHAVKQLEAGKQLDYEGFFGAKMYLVHRKVKSGGRDVYITDLMPTEEFTQNVMEPIKRGLKKRNEVAQLSGAAGNVSLLNQAGQQLLEGSSEEAVEIDGPVDMDVSDEKEIAVNFDADAADGEVIEEAPAGGADDFKGSQEPSEQTGSDMGKEVAESLMAGSKETPEKS